MVDPHGRKIDYLRLSVTDRCNLRCQYCMPESGIEKGSHGAVLRNEDYLEIVKVLAKMGIQKVRLTGGEPLVRKGLPSLIKDIWAIEGIRDVSLTTNGILLDTQLDALMEAGIKRINISLDTLNSETYRNLTRGGDLDTVLRGIQRAIDCGMAPIKLNVVVIHGMNHHEIDDFLNAFDPSVEVRFIELMPIGEAAGWSKDRFLNLNEYIAHRDDLIPLENHGHGGPCRYYTHKETGRVVGVINAISDHFCPSCNRIRITADGHLKTCLHDSEEVDLRPYVHQADQLETLIASTIGQKPLAHLLNHEDMTPIARNMYTIGG